MYPLKDISYSCAEFDTAHIQRMLPLMRVVVVVFFELKLLCQIIDGTIDEPVAARAKGVNEA
jgi:hypothetical protein